MKQLRSLGILFCILLSPAAHANKKIIFIASDLRNGGVQGVENGFMEAIRELSWEVEVKDGAGDIKALTKILKNSLHSKADGIVLGGFQPDPSLASEIRAKPANMFLIGWHAGVRPGHTKELFTNITTDPMEVARNAAQAVDNIGAKKAGVVIITDNQFAVAKEKVRQITDILKKSHSSRVLSVEDVPIANAQKDIPGLVSRLNGKFGRSWTHTVAINDIYFDNMNFPLKEIGRSDVTNIAAGDGSSVAISRIRSGASQQAVTVAEPLIAQGWQIADEFHRAFAGKKESGFVFRPMTVTQEVLLKMPGEDIESPRSFREAYASTWKRKR